MVACFPRGKLLLFSVYVNSSHLTTRVEYFGIIGSRLIAECFAFIFHCNLTAADMQKFRVSAYRRINTVLAILQQISDKHAPLRRLNNKMKRPLNKLWISKAIATSIKCKQGLFKDHSAESQRMKSLRFLFEICRMVHSVNKYIV